jgi:glycosyltransferase involved in cell wall biosynthesis
MKILVLSTWFPYPLSQGSKIRAYHLIQGLAQQHEVALLSFEDVPVEADSIAHMRQICTRVDVVHQNPFAPAAGGKVQALRGWLSAQPSIAQSSYSPDMAQQVRRIVDEWRPEAIFALTFITAPYALAAPGARLRRVIDIDNLMTPMLVEATGREQQPLRRLRNGLAAAKFRAYERQLYRQFDLCLVTSEPDCQTAQQMLALRPEQVGLAPNGVAVGMLPNVTVTPGSLIYNGALTYDANYDAMAYFLGDIFPRIRAAAPEAHLTITGSTRGVNLAALPADDHVTFSGYVDNIHARVAGSWACVAPLRMGGGTRLKILEAMALGTPVVSTRKGAAGLDVQDGQHLLIADDPATFAAQTVRVLHDPILRQALAAQAAQRVQERYDWAAIGRHVCELVEGISA